MWRSRRSAALDLGIAGFVTVVTSVLAWTDTAFFGEPLSGPQVIAALLPFFLGAPLAFRRTRPLLVCALVWGGLAVYCLTSGATEGLHCIVAFLASGYSVAAYSSRRNALAGLAVIVAGYGVYAFEVPGLAASTGDQWATAFFATMTLAAWLLGFGIHGRREEVALTRRAHDLESTSRHAVQDERGRIARELHDIVSHRLSVVVVQAAGARAKSGDASETLEKIEGQAREALVEMRRMLGLLRDDGEDASVLPTPGLAELPQLVESMCEAGLPVQLTLSGDVEQVPRAVALSAYRIVQESLTNALRHSGARRGQVCITARPHELDVTVTDNGHGIPEQATMGHGLTGMRERAHLLGGQLAIQSSQTGVTVHAVLPLTVDA